MHLQSQSTREPTVRLANSKPPHTFLILAPGKVLCMPSLMQRNRRHIRVQVNRIGVRIVVVPTDQSARQDRLVQRGNRTKVYRHGAATRLFRTNRRQSSPARIDLCARASCRAR